MEKSPFYPVFLFCLLGCCFSVSCRPAVALSQSAEKTHSLHTYKVDVPATAIWVDTKIDLLGGAKVRFTATGTITYPTGQTPMDRLSTSGTFGPAGLARGFADLLHQYPVNDAGHGALIARIGDTTYAQPFLVGVSKEYDVPIAGRLYLGLNQSKSEGASATGGFKVQVDLLAAGTGTTAALSDTPIAGITPDLLARIPRRVTDPEGNPGDMVNVFLVGTQEQVLQAFAAAGWVQVDKSAGGSAIEAILDSLEKKDYLTMPMSTLMLFNRPQDYGLAHGEAVKVAMSRHHLRLWKSPYEVGGRPLWCISSTHDIGFERDQRNNGITHKIDPNIDTEREFVSGTLVATGLVAQRDHVTPADPLTTAKTATGGEFHSDGRISVLVLTNTGGKPN
jgi:hypothetical protein